MNYIDIHSHLNIKPLSENIEEVVSRMREKGVSTITVGVDYETSKKELETAEKYPDVILGVCVGQHPTDSDEEFDIEKFREMTKNSKVVAIGETGLDYYRVQMSNNQFPISNVKDRQKEIFKKHIELAMELNKPLMIHARPSKGTMDAYEEVLEILESYYNLKPATSNLVGNFHFFVGDVEIAKRILALGFTVSFDGPITFARDYDEVIKFLPLESIMAETDAPFAMPEPYRTDNGFRAAPPNRMVCESWMVEEVYKKIAEIKDMDPEAVRIQILKNAQNFFKI